VNLKLPRSIGQKTEIPGHDRTLVVKKVDSGTYFLRIRGQQHARWGNAKQSKEDIVYFVDTGALPRERFSWYSANDGELSPSAKRKIRDEARADAKQLHPVDRSAIIDAMVLGNFDWRDWTDRKPPPGYLNALFDELIMLEEIEG
jgi:hypothetical protein